MRSKERRGGRSDGAKLLLPPMMSRTEGTDRAGDESEKWTKSTYTRCRIYHFVLPTRRRGGVLLLYFYATLGREISPVIRAPIVPV